MTTASSNSAGNAASNGNNPSRFQKLQLIERPDVPLYPEELSEDEKTLFDRARSYAPLVPEILKKLMTSAERFAAERDIPEDISYDELKNKYREMSASCMQTQEQISKLARECTVLLIVYGRDVSEIQDKYCKLLRSNNEHIRDANNAIRDSNDHIRQHNALLEEYNKLHRLCLALLTGK